MARSRNTSKTRRSQPSKSPARARASPGRKSAGAAATPASKSPARRTASPGRPRKTSASPGRTPAKKGAAAKTPAKTPAKSPAKAVSKSPARPKTPQKAPPRPKSPVTASARRRQLSQSSSRSRTTSEAASTATRSPSPTHRRQTSNSNRMIPVRVDDSSSGFFSSLRPRRNRDLEGVDSSRIVHYRIVDPEERRRTPASKSILPKINWPTWKTYRKVKDHFRRNVPWYLGFLAFLILAVITYYFGHQITKQLKVMQHALYDIYEEQRQRLGTFWESPTEKAARENALPPPPPPHREPAPVKPPNPHHEKVPRGQI